MRATRASAVWITASFFKDFYLKNAIVALEHDWQKYFVIILFKDGILV